MTHSEDNAAAWRSALRRWLDPFAKRAATPPPYTLRAFFGWSYAGFETPMIIMIGFALAVGLTEVALIDAVGQLVDALAGYDFKDSDARVFLSNHANLLIWFALLAAVARPLTMIGQAAMMTLIISPSLFTSILWRLHRYTLGQSLSFFEADFAGRLAQKEQQTAQAVDAVTLDLINALGILIGFLIAMTAALALIDPRIALITVLWAAGYAAALRYCLPLIRADSKIRAERRSRVIGQFVDSFTNIKTVKLFAHAGHEEREAQQALDQYYASAIDVGVATMRLRLLLGLLNALLMVGAVAGPLWLWLDGAAGAGAVAASAMLAFRLTGMSGWIAFTLLGVFREIGAAEDGVETLSKPHAILDPPKPTRPPKTDRAGAILFKDVHFDYDGGGVKAIRAFDLSIKPGERVGLVGPSGAGKSTIVALLLRLYDRSAGAIKLGDVDISDMAQDDLRKQIAVVSQDPSLFNRSVLDNIRYGRVDATRSEVIEAARNAQADAFIRDLEDRRGRAGYEAEIGERGVRLSGGQRQRLAIARAFLKDAPVLVLDEATSALDSAVEAEVLDALGALMSEKTVIAIAHRLSTIAAMDRIIVMNAGGVIEAGRHDELVAAEGMYADLWARQSGGFLGSYNRGISE